jgi:hypothetical protein
MTAMSRPRLRETRRVEAEYRAPYLAHAPLEPISAIVRVDEDSAEVWTGTQIPRFMQHNVARIAGIGAGKGYGPCASIWAAASATGWRTRWSSRPPRSPSR